MNRILDRILARLSAWHHRRQAQRLIQEILDYDTRSRSADRHRRARFDLESE